ncbi:hypothetical protein B0G57_104257 [Trinickia symbiotica]|uniref:Uncharacterized protein n=2 Tax=Trinickia symbiotica TaxID=863227 RepID=A0A2N7X337_9BURK|nr:hypothetical protein C0Z20_15070 [Trinickia symbiotica]PPK45852.1 hypothetical protein B0G57_104257 [Trinickia symbiotica]
MSFNKRLLMAVALCACTACHATERHRYACPSPLTEGSVNHALKHVELYDGPPKNLVSLQAWDSLKDVDPYLVCSYEGTDKVVTIHAAGSKACDATAKPKAAFCD